VTLFDALARKHLRMSGERAYQRIRSSRVGESYVWTDLYHLSLLFPKNFKWPGYNKFKAKGLKNK
jgi:hypothetical protein